MKALVEGLGDITAHVDCHNIISQVSDYCLFYPRFANQPNNVMTEMLSEMSRSWRLCNLGFKYISFI